VSDADFLKLLLGSSVIATFVSLGVNRWFQSTKEEGERKSAKAAIQAEMESAAKNGFGYLKPRAVVAVGWRASTMLYETAFPKLLALGAVNKECADALLGYYQNLEAFNRALEAIAEHKGQDRMEEAKASARLAMVKAIEIMPSEMARETAQGADCPPAVKAKIEAKLAKRNGRTLYDRAWVALSWV
jgi:hypothetical protein